MTPQVHLREVSKEDVTRVSRWLEDDEVCSRWLGRLESGEPMHLDYWPREMLEASAEKWKRVFHDPHRRILSVYTVEGEHIGEAHIALQDFLGWAELSFLIGRRDLCRQGYGTATLHSLLDNGGAGIAGADLVALDLNLVLLAELLHLLDHLLGLCVLGADIGVQREPPIDLYDVEDVDLALRLFGQLAGHL